MPRDTSSATCWGQLKTAFDRCPRIDTARSIEIRRPLAAGTHGERHHLHICEIRVWDGEGGQIDVTCAEASPQVAAGVNGNELPPRAIEGNYVQRAFGVVVKLAVGDG